MVVPQFPIERCVNQTTKKKLDHIKKKKGGKYSVFVTSFLEQDKMVNMQPVNACWINLFRTKWKQKCTQLSNRMKSLWLLLRSEEDRVL